jgi:hypothetical protein
MLSAELRKEYYRDLIAKDPEYDGGFRNYRKKLALSLISPLNRSFIWELIDLFSCSNSVYALFTRFRNRQIFYEYKIDKCSKSIL